MNRRTVLRAAATAASAVLLTAAATACSSSGAGSSDGKGRTTVRIAYQEIPNADLVVKDKRLLEQALPDADIKWVKFDSGGDVNTAVLVARSTSAW